MPKKVLQDIIKPLKLPENGEPDRKWDYQDMMRPKSTEFDAPSEEVEADSAEPASEYEVTPPVTPKRGKKRSSGGMLTTSRIAMAVLGVVLIGGFFVMTAVSSKAMVKVMLAKQVVTLDDIFSVTELGVETSLPYELITLTKSDVRKVIATHEEEVERKASGTIVIYNEYKESPQTYVRKTRFQSPDGKIYRVDSQVVVPGMKSDGTPGTVEVEVYADQNGAEYNLGMVDFTIPGLKGSDSFKKVYARSKTPMMGGYVGVLRSASDEDLALAEDELATSLRGQLLAEIDGAVDANTVLVFDDGVFVTFTSETGNDETSSDQVQLHGDSTLRAFAFSKKTLSQAIARKELSSYTASDENLINVRNFDDLTFRFIDKDDFDPVLGNEFKIEIKGDAQLVWELDEARLKEELLGQKKDVFIDLVKTYPSIRKAELKLDPFWKVSFPNDVEDITVEEME